MEWRPIRGFEDLYEVSSNGDVRRIGAQRYLKWWLAGQYKYRAVTLYRDGKRSKFYVAHLVAWAFLGYRKLGQRKRDWQINHKDGCNTNNSSENIEYLIASEHAARHGASRVGESNPSSKLNSDDVRAIRASTCSYRELASKYCVHYQLIYQIRARMIWKHL